MARRLRRPVQSVRGRSWIRAGDTVQVMAGDDAPRRGKVLRVLPQTSQIVVEGMNKVFKHVRKSQQHPKGGRLEKEAPIALANVALVCASCGAPSRRKVRITDTKKKGRGESGPRVHKERVCSACQAVIPLPGARK